MFSTIIFEFYLSFQIVNNSDNMNPASVTNLFQNNEQKRYLV